MKRVVWFLIGLWCIWAPGFVAFLLVPENWEAMPILFGCLLTLWLASMCIPFARHECAGTGSSQPVPAPLVVSWCECCGSDDDVRVHLDGAGYSSTLCGECSELAAADTEGDQ